MQKNKYLPRLFTNFLFYYEFKVFDKYFNLRFHFKILKKLVFFFFSNFYLYNKQTSLLTVTPSTKKKTGKIMLIN